MTFVVRDIPYDSGIYVLTVSLRDGREIEVGARGSIFFPGGYYYYCGSAQKNLSARLSRHLRTEKKFHWHIDYLLAWAEVLNFHTWSAGRKGECRLASCLQRLPGAEVVNSGFGASDCGCETHLIYFQEQLGENNFPDRLFSFGNES